MVTADRIQQYLEQLPSSFQAEVLDFVEFLLAKADRDVLRPEAKAWSEASVAFAMRGMEDEETPGYTTADLKVVFS